MGNYPGKDKIIVERLQRKYEGKVDILEEFRRLHRASEQDCVKSQNGACFEAVAAHCNV